MSTNGLTILVLPEQGLAIGKERVGLNGPTPLYQITKRQLLALPEHILLPMELVDIMDVVLLAMDSCTVGVGALVPTLGSSVWL